jgi:membrane protein YqaA with SNARE-associated domain
MKALLSKVQFALVAYGPWGIFVLALIDSLGIPLPGAMDFLIIGVAASSVHTPRVAYFTALMAVVGSLAGNIALFLAAQHGRKLFRRNEPAPGKRRKFAEWFERYGLLTVFVPAVTPVLPLPLKVFVISAGAMRTSLSRFVAVILTARVVRYFGEAYLGLKLGEDAKGFLMRNGWTLGAIAAAFAAAAFLVARTLDRRRATLQTAE